MSSKTKSVTAVLIVLALVAGVGMTKVGSKYKKHDKVNLIFANATSNSAKKAGEKFKELVEEYSDGDITVDLFQDNQLGDDKTVAEGVQNGDIDIAVSSSSSLSTLYKDYYIYDTPYLFLNSQEVYDVGFDGKAAQEMLKGVSKVGLKHMAMWENGFRNCTNNDHAIETPADCKGQKIRTMENAYHLQFWKQMGANPTPMSFSEVYIGLQQGTIDAQENAYEIIVSAKLYEQQKYLISTNAVPDYTTLIVSDEFYQGLTKEQQKIIDQAAEIAQEKARESADDRRVQRQKVLEDEGMQIVDVDQKTWKQMQEKCQPVYDSIRKQAGDKLVDLYMGK